MYDSWWMIGLTLFGGLGFGSMISSIISKKYDRKRMILEVKLTKYSNLIQSYQDVVSGGSTESLRQNYVSSQKQVELIGSNEVVSLSKKLYEAPDIEGRIRDSIVIAMKNDLNKYL